MDAIQSFDRTVINYFYHIASTNNLVGIIAQVLALGTIYIVPLFLIFLWYAKSKESIKNKILALEILASGLVSWQIISRLVKTFYFRNRPFANSSINVQELLFHRPDQSFPSDHASLIFAFTFALYLFGNKKLGHIFLCFSILVSLARVATGLHYPSDIIGGVIVGFLAALSVYLLRIPFEKYIAYPLISLCKKVNLY